MSRAITTLFLIIIASCIQAQNINRQNIPCPMGINVNSFTGNLFMERNDLYIEGRKLPIDLTFYYNSVLDTFNLGYGKGWTMQYFMKYETMLKGIRIRRGDGFAMDYDQVSAIDYKAPTGVFDLLVKYSLSPVKFLLTDKYGTEYYFDDPVSKRVTQIKEINGNYLNFSYTNGLLAQITDAAGRSVQLDYGANGLLNKITDAITQPVREIKYSYDGYGNLIKVEDPLGQKLTYDYIINGPIRRLADKNGNIADIIYNSAYNVKEVITCNTNQRFSYDKANGITLMAEQVSGKNQTTTYRYNNLGYITHKQGNCCGFDNSFDYDDNGNAVKFTDANGHVSTFTYDSRGNMLSKTDPLGKTLRITYNGISQVKSFTDKNGNTTSFVFDNSGNIITATYPEGITNSFTYYGNGDKKTSTDGNGNTTTYSYDAYGNQTSIQKPLGVTFAANYDARSRLVSVTDPINHSTTFNYDVLDRLLSVTDAASHAIAVTYDANNNVTSYTDRNNHKTILNYDASDRLVKVTNALGNSVGGNYDERNNLTSFKDENGNQTMLAYDNLNRLVQVVNAAREVTQYDYMPNGKLSGIVYPNGNHLTITRDARDQVTKINDDLGILSQRQYDARGNLTSSSNGLGNSVSFQYDRLNRLAKRTDPLGFSESYSYDKNYNILSFTDKNRHSKSVAYDALNRAISYTDALNFTTNYVYDAAGNLAKITDAKGNPTTYSYDNLNRQVATVYANNIGSTATYDANNNVMTYTDGKGVTTHYLYDATDQLLKMDFPGADDYSYTYDKAGNLTGAVNADAVVNFSYDALNRILSESLNGKTTSYSYDIPKGLFGLQYPSGRNITKAFDGRNRLAGISESNKQLFTASYDAANQMTGRLDGNGGSTNFSYDAGGRLLGKQTNSIPAIGFEYAYDNAGNILAEKKTHKPDHSLQYIYDNEDQLTEFNYGTLNGASISNPTHHQKFNYDGLGNRTIAIFDNETVQYASNSLNQYTQINGNTSTSQSFDNNGNLITSSSNNYAYNTLDQLKSVNNTNFKYDALNRMIASATGNDSTVYNYSFLNAIEIKKTGSDVSNVFGKGLDNLISFKTNAQDYFAMQNNVNSVTSTSDNTNHVAEHFEYDPFGSGNIFNSTYSNIANSSTGNEFQFSGRNKIGSTGLYNFRFRHYDLRQGRFIQRDPLEYTDGMNNLTFVNDNPANRIDPMGLSSRNNALCGENDELKVKGAESKYKFGKELLKAARYTSVLKKVTELADYLTYATIILSPFEFYFDAKKLYKGEIGLGRFAVHRLRYYTVLISGVALAGAGIIGAEALFATIVVGGAFVAVEEVYDEIISISNGCNSGNSISPEQFEKNYRTLPGRWQ